MEEEIIMVRHTWMDVIKVLSAFLIVMQHSISGAWTTLDVESSSWMVINIIFLLSRMAVPAFVMCSGAGMLSRERSISDVWKRNIWGLFRTYMVWMFIYGIWDCTLLIVAGEYNPIKWGSAIVKDIVFGHYHTWFIMMLLGLYMITPFLCVLFQKKYFLEYFLLLAIVFTVVLPQIEMVDKYGRLATTIANINMKFVIGYVLYFVLGYYLTIKKWEISKYCIWIFASCFIGVAFFSRYISINTGIANQELMQEFHPVALVFNILAFLCAKSIFENLSKDKVARKFLKLGKLGIAVYLMHPLFMFIIPKKSGVNSILVGIAIYGISLGISYLLGINKFSRKYFLQG